MQQHLDIRCYVSYHHNIMRTTVNIDDPILKELKKLQKKRGKSLGRLISDLLAEALRNYGTQREGSVPPVWISRPMNARLDLDDKEALYAALERHEPPTQPEERK